MYESQMKPLSNFVSDTANLPDLSGTMENDLCTRVALQRPLPM